MKNSPSEVLLSEWERKSYIEGNLTELAIALKVSDVLADLVDDLYFANEGLEDLQAQLDDAEEQLRDLKR